MSATFQEPQKANFLPYTILGQETSGGDEQQSRPGLSLAAQHTGLCNTQSPMSSRAAQECDLKPSSAWCFVRTGHTRITCQQRRDMLIQGVLQVECKKFGSTVRNVPVFNIYLELHQQGHSDRKSKQPPVL